MTNDAEFTGESLIRLVVDIERAVGNHKAGATPLGRAVTILCESAIGNDLKASRFLDVVKTISNGCGTGPC